MSKFTNIRPGEAELFHADRQTDGHDEANSRFSQLCESSEEINLPVLSRT